mgnify:CR=1 FL=1
MIWLIGAGPMAGDYADVLKSLGVDFKVITRSKDNAVKLSESKKIEVISGGVSNFLASSPSVCDAAIVAVPIDQLNVVTTELINYGVKNVLLEKPGGIDFNEVTELCEKSKAKGAEISIAYNRRFYASVMKAKQLIESEGGVTSFHFEFTEWSDSIAKLKKGSSTKKNWLMANSSHVIDLAFYLGGEVSQLAGFSSGENRLDWHKASSKYSGAGCTKNGATFSYCANWDAPGRWALEFMTPQNRYYFKPMEKLFVQARNSVALSEVEVDYSLEETFKPGLYQQVKAFLNTEAAQDLLSLERHLKKRALYETIENGGSLEIS